MKTRVVQVGDVYVGGANPVRVQSMTTTDPQDIPATASQVERLVDVGCEIVRVTTPSVRDAELLCDLRRELDRRGVRVPLVADVHFAPNAALRALEFADKVRINPGNFVDRKRFESRTYSDAQYAEELEKLADRLRPLVSRARELGRALRIGTNHGSLSDRIMNRFGDSSIGMVESALEFLDVCESEGFRDVVFSMKSSNPVVMIEAYRRLARRLAERTGADGETYPLHLGVTEAGSGRDGRIKSAIGIGTLLEDGLGDTLRVSLTEDPVCEIPVAQALASRAKRQPADLEVEVPVGVSRFDVRPRAVAGVEGAGLRRGLVEIEVGRIDADPDASAARLAEAFEAALPLACEGIVVDADDSSASNQLPRYVHTLRRTGVQQPVLVRTASWLDSAALKTASGLIFRIGADTPDELIRSVRRVGREAATPIEWAFRESAGRLDELVDRVLAGGPRSDGLQDRFSLESGPFVPQYRRLAQRLIESGLPPLLALRHQGQHGESEDERVIHLAADLGTLLEDGLGDRISIGADRSPGDALDLIYRVLQGARVRISRAEFISCPSCGRTQFDLEDVTARIQRRTRHLRDVKIAIMGCIVNGPGEMADADFGYVGAGPGEISLYVGRTLVVRHVPADEAVSRLEALIRDHGRWIDPPDDRKAAAGLEEAR